MPPTELAAANGALGVAAAVQLCAAVGLQRLLGPVGLIAANALGMGLRAVLACGAIGHILLPKRQPNDSAARTGPASSAGLQSAIPVRGAAAVTVLARAAPKRAVWAALAAGFMACMASEGRMRASVADGFSFGLAAAAHVTVGAAAGLGVLAAVLRSEPDLLKTMLINLRRDRILLGPAQQRGAKDKKVL